MKKSLVAVLVALVVGFSGGLWFAHARVAPQLAQAAQRAQQLERQCADLKTATEEMTTQISQMQERSEKLTREIGPPGTRRRETLKNRPAPGAADGTAEFGRALAEAFSGAPGNAAATAARTPASAAEGVSQEEPDPTEVSERFRARYRDNIRWFMNQQIQDAADPESQERLGAIADYAGYIADLRQQIRDAQTEEQKEALRQELLAARETAGQLLSEQREVMLRQAAIQCGLETPEEQDVFARAVTDTLQNPLFSMQDYTWDQAIVGLGKPQQGSALGGNAPPAP